MNDKTVNGAVNPTFDQPDRFREDEIVMVDDDPDQAYTLLNYHVETGEWRAHASGTGKVRRVNNSKLMKLPGSEFSMLHSKLLSGKSEQQDQGLSESRVLAVTYTPEQEHIGKSREVIIKALESGEIKTKDEAMAKMGLKRSAFRDVLQAYALDPNWRSLVPKAPGRLPGTNEQDPELLKLFNQAFDDFYVNYGAKLPPVYGAFEDLCKAAGKVPFSKSTAYRIFKKIDPKIRDKKKEGADFANKKFEPYPSSYELDGPFARAQIDSTVADIIIVDELTGKVLGRPYLTVVEDEFTGGILAIYVSFSAPSRAVIAAALYQSFTPKNKMLIELGIREDAWFLTGPAACYLVDKGSEHDNKHFRATCNKYGIKYEYRRRVQTGGAVESAIRLINTGFVQRLEGSTGSAPRHHRDFNPEGKAEYDLMEFNRLVQSEAIRLNGMSRERGRLSPNKRAIRWFATNKYGIKVPPVMRDPEGFMINMLPGKRVPVKREGLLYNGILYDHGPVRHLVERKIKVSVRQNPLDLHYLYVLHENVWHKVSVLKPGRAPKTEAQRKVEQRSGDPVGSLDDAGVAARQFINDTIRKKRDEKSLGRASASRKLAQQQGLITPDKAEPVQEIVETNRFAHVRPFKGDEDK